MHIVFFVCALASIAAVVLICLFLFANGIPAMKEIGLLNFLTGAKWKPGNDIYGILPMILGSIYITAGAVVIGVPVGLLTAIFILLPEKALRPAQALHRAARRHPLHRLRLFRHGRHRAVHPHRRRAVRRGHLRLVHPRRVRAARHHDPADRHRRLRGRAARGTVRLL